jgi:hypothetical protein
LAGARYVSAISTDSMELKGTLSIGGNDIPLNLKRAPNQ